MGRGVMVVALCGHAYIKLVGRALLRRRSVVDASALLGQYLRPRLAENDVSGFGQRGQHAHPFDVGAPQPVFIHLAGALWVGVRRGGLE